MWFRGRAQASGAARDPTAVAPPAIDDSARDRTCVLGSLDRCADSNATDMKYSSQVRYPARLLVKAGAASSSMCAAGAAPEGLVAHAGAAAPPGLEDEGAASSLRARFMG